jgi:hypothetical protein
MANDSLHRRALVYFGVAVLGLLGAIAGAGLAALAGWAGHREAIDATPSELVAPGGRFDDGARVWLRGLRDRDRPVSAGGRTLYPALDDARVMVDCGAGSCEGALVGRVEDLELPGVGPVRVVVVGELGSLARGRIALASAVGIACSVAALVFAVLGTAALARARRARTGPVTA